MHIPQDRFDTERVLGAHAIGAPHTALDISEISAGWFNHSKAKVARLQTRLARDLGTAQEDESLVIPPGYCLPYHASTSWCHGIFGKSYHSDFKWHPSEALAVHLATWQEGSEANMDGRKQCSRTGPTMCLCAFAL